MMGLSKAQKAEQARRELETKSYAEAVEYAEACKRAMQGVAEDAESIGEIEVAVEVRVVYVIEMAERIDKPG